MKITETLLISASIGCFILWIMEFRRTGSFGEHYWLIMLCLAFLLGFQYVRTQRLNRSGQGPVVTFKQPKKKPTRKKKS
ncbi:hypothetical protein [Larkinella soli]|uniref:hypothetical protein n=1 Tax=Larkinella soli TaxID=1770527 RepID=UPI000FFBC77B|nr:hypothetical protein [Larkinella soli]